MLNYQRVPFDTWTIMNWSTFVNISRVSFCVFPRVPRTFLARYEKVDIADNGKDKKILHKASRCDLEHHVW